jgi:serine/threonine-protein kinase
MAEVFLAVKTGPDGFERRVALKRILPHLSESDEFRTMFLDEARLAARLSHPHVVQVFDFGKVDDYSFIAMELVDGVDLGRLVDQPPGALGEPPKPVPFAVAARIFADAAGGLHHAHSVGLVHRDVTPQNILVSYEGVVKIVDFGIAKAAWQARHTRPGVVKGKFAYLSPEQVDGRVLDGRSDVFSLGICLWETLTGAALIRRDDARAAMRQIRDGDGADFAAAARRRRPDLPEGLERILARALAVDVDERYESAGELQADLERYLKGAAELATAREVGEFVSAVAPRLSVDHGPEMEEDGTARVEKLPAPEVRALVRESPSEETELSPPPPGALPTPTPTTIPSPSPSPVHDAPTRNAALPDADDATMVAISIPGDVEREVLAAQRARETQVTLEAAGTAATREPRRNGASTAAASGEARRARRIDDHPPGSVTDPVPLDELLADEGARTSAGVGVAAHDEGAFSSETTLSLDEERARALAGAATSTTDAHTLIHAPPSSASAGDDTSASTRIHLPLDRGGDEPSTPTPTGADGEDAPTREHHRVAAPGPLRTGLLPRTPLVERTAVLALVALTLVLVIVAAVGLLRRSRARTIDDVDPVTVSPAPRAPVGPSTPAPAPTVVATPIAGDAPPADALVDVLSRPEGASVVIDGEPLATTPARGLTLAPGRHLVSVELTGHRPRRMSVVVAAGEHRTLDVELAPVTHKPHHRRR